MLPVFSCHKIGGFISLELKFKDGFGGSSSWSYNSITKQAFEICETKQDDEGSGKNAISSDDDVLSRGSVVVSRRSPACSHNRKYTFQTEEKAVYFFRRVICIGA